MTRGEKALALRREKGREWTQEKIASEMVRLGADVNRGWVANLETNRLRKPYVKDLHILAQVLGKPESYFTDDAEPPAPAPTPALWKIPIEGHISKTSFTRSTEAATMEFLQPPGGPQCKAIRVLDDSLAPTLLEGEIIVVDELVPIRDGALIVLFYDGQWWIGRGFRKEALLELRPLQRNLKPIRAPWEQMTCKGVVVWSCRSH